MNLIEKTQQYAYLVQYNDWNLDVSTSVRALNQTWRDTNNPSSSSDSGNVPARICQTRSLSHHHHHNQHGQQMQHALQSLDNSYTHHQKFSTRFMCVCVGAMQKQIVMQAAFTPINSTSIDRIYTITRYVWGRSDIRTRIQHYPHFYLMWKSRFLGYSGQNQWRKRKEFIFSDTRQIQVLSVYA